MSKETSDTQLLSSEIKLYYLQNLAEHRPGRENRAMAEYELNLSDSWHLSADKTAAEQDEQKRKSSRATATASRSLYRLRAVAQTRSGKVSILRNKQAECTFFDRFPLLYFVRWSCRLIKKLLSTICSAFSRQLQKYLPHSPMPHGQRMIQAAFIERNIERA